jgi:hypothetical protein
LDAVASRDEETLRTRLAQARDARDGLVRDLHGVDAELEALAPERKPYRLLELVCGALEDLDALGAAKLFWGERDAEGPSRIRLARGRLDLFQKRLAEIEERREAVADEIDRWQAKVEGLEDELDELERQEELRKLEWRIERDESALPARALVMPWSRGGDDDRRFRRSLAASLALCLLAMLLVPRIPLPLRALDDEPLEIPERLTRLLMEARPLPPAPPREAVPQAPQQLAEREPEEAPQPAAKSEGPGRGSSEGEGEGPAQGPGKGILAFREKFSHFEQTQNVPRLGSEARIRSPAEASGKAERAMVTTRAPGSSGGIDLAALSRGVGGGGGAGSGGGAALAGVQVARATSTIGGGGGSGRGSGSAGGPPLGRTDEEIQIVFDRHKSALYRLYNRELRNDPTLQGQMVLRIRIEPDGSVSLCELQATDMEAPQLAAQVVDRVRGFDFGAKDVPPVTILYPIDFLPAT